MGYVIVQLNISDKSCLFIHCFYDWVEQIREFEMFTEKYFLCHNETFYCPNMFQ